MSKRVIKLNSGAFKHKMPKGNAYTGSARLVDKSIYSSEAIKKITKVKLDPDQASLKTRIFNFINEHLSEEQPAVFIVDGDAGTGKSVILNALFNECQYRARKVAEDPLYGTKNYLVVNHPEMLKLYHHISKDFDYLKKSDLQRPTSLINTFTPAPESTKKKSGNQRKANKTAKPVNTDSPAVKPIDVLFIDEAHLLTTHKDAFKRFHQMNQFEELLKLSKVVVVIFDEKQSLRMNSYWSDSTLEEQHHEKRVNGASLHNYLKNCTVETHKLKKQFRVTAQKDLLEWITALSTRKVILPLPTKDQEEGTFDFKIYKSCAQMYQDIKEKDKEYGSCRILATYDFPYRLDGKDYFVTSQSDDFKLRWDRYLPQIQIPWSERADTIDEVGSVYTVQGFDLNYAGVILGKSIGYDKTTDTIQIRPEFYDDHAGFTKKSNIYDVDDVKERIILNSINVLLTRGVKGLYIFAWDNELRMRLLAGNKSVVVE